MTLMRLFGETSESWREEALCRGLALRRGRSDDFFPQRAHPFTGELRNTDRLAEGKAYCVLCPVREECLDYANNNRLQDGFWGGMTSNGREKARRKLRASHDRFVADLEPIVREVANAV